MTPVDDVRTRPSPGQLANAAGMQTLNNGMKILSSGMFQVRVTMMSPRRGKRLAFIHDACSCSINSSCEHAE
eukprot:3880429-Rhodomonas_salina.1